MRERRAVVLLGVVAALCLRSTTVGAQPAYQFANIQLGEVADGRVTVKAPMTLQAPFSGYAPFWMDLTSRSSKKESLVLQTKSSNGGAVVRREVTLEPNEHRRVFLPLPVELQSFRTSVEGDAITTKTFAAGWVGTHLSLSVLALGTEESFRGFVGSEPSTSPQVSVLAIDGDTYPEELSAYVGFSGVVLLDRTFESLPSSVQTALEAYVATGGRLVVEKPSPGLAKVFGGQAAAATSARPIPHHFGAWKTCPTRNVCGRDFLDELSSNLPVQPSNGSGRDYRVALYRPYPSERSPLLSQAQPPVGRFVALLVLFALLVGPGSLWVARQKGALLLLLTIPGISLLSCTAAVTHSLWVDGLKVYSSAYSYTWLDRKQARSVTVGLGAYYPSFTPWQALAYGNTTALLFSGRGELPSPSIDWNAGPTFTDGYLPSRRYREWGVLSVQPSRARLVLQPQGAGEPPRVMNALGLPITSGRLLHGGRVYALPALADGEAGAALFLPASASTEPPTTSSIDTAAADRFANTVVEQFLKLDHDGEFIAEVRQSGPLPEGGLKTTRSEDLHLIRGEAD